MHNLTIQDQYGNTLVFDRIGSPYTISAISGIAAPPVRVNYSESALMDGASYNSIKAEVRTINLAFAIEGPDTEANRLEVYRVLRAKHLIRINYKSKYREVYIEGYVQTMDVTHVEAPQTLTVEILCLSPFWRSAAELVTELSATISTFHFPFYSTSDPMIVMGYYDASAVFEIMNEGSVDTGMTIHIVVINADVSNPKIINYITGEYIQLNFDDFAAGTEIVITTEQGKKTVTKYYNGVATNIFNLVEEGSTFLQLRPGANEFVYTVATGNATNLEISIDHHDLFEGV